MAYQRPQLPHLSVVQAKAASILACRGAEFSFSLMPAEGVEKTSVKLSTQANAAQPHTWQLQLAPNQSDHLTDSRGDAETHTLSESQSLPPKHLGLDWGDARFDLAFSPGVWETWLAARMPEMDRVALPPPFVDAAVEAMMLEFTAGLENITLRSPQTESAVQDQAVLDNHVWTLTGRDVTTQRQLAATLTMDERGLSRLAELFVAVEPASNDLCLEAVMLQLHAVLGSTTLKIGELRTCMPGDIIFFDESWALDTGECWLATADGQAIRIRAMEPHSVSHIEPASIFTLTSNSTSTFFVTQGWTLLMTDKLLTDSDQNNFLRAAQALRSDSDAEEDLFDGKNEDLDVLTATFDDDSDDQDDDDDDDDDDIDDQDDDYEADDDSDDQDDDDDEDEDDDIDDDDEEGDGSDGQDDSDDDEDDDSEDDDVEDEGEDDDVTGDDADDSDDEDDDETWMGANPLDAVARSKLASSKKRTAQNLANTKAARSTKSTKARKSTEVQTDPQTTLNVDAVPIRLTFELGTRAFTLGDLRRLHPGVVFDLDRPLNKGPVQICANGQQIGCAELVEIEGRVGARIVQLRSIKSE